MDTADRSAALRAPELHRYVVRAVQAAGFAQLEPVTDVATLLPVDLFPCLRLEDRQEETRFRGARLGKP